MNRGLSVSGVVNVDVLISPLAAAYKNFGIPVLVSDEEVIDVGERVRFYRNIDEVIEEFGGSGPAYDAAVLHFSQLPRPDALYIGRWARTPSKAILHGGVLDVADLDMATWTSITTGSMTITVDGTLKTLTSLNFSTATNLNQVATIIQAGSTGFTVRWDAAYERFDIISNSTGTSSTISYGAAAGSGTDISSKAKLRTGQANAPINGVVAETALAAVQAVADRSGDWYAVAITAATMPSDNDLVDISAYIEGTERNRLHIITTQASAALDPLSALDIGSRLKALKYMRSYVQYSSTHKFAAVSAFARAATVDFESNRSTITLKFKQLPGVGVDILTETQSKVLKSKNINVFVQYDNGSAILQEGVMSNGFWFDEVHGGDWLANALQTDEWNVLYQSQTKIPQTDEGIHQLVASAEGVCERAVNNGFLASGTWTGGQIGILLPGMTLSRGYYVYAPPVASQAPADREARKAPTIQIACKLAGAVHFANLVVSLNR
jgi:hypothetical protein